MISPVIVDENVLVPAIVSFPVFITAPAAATFVASVTSAEVSIPDNLVLSALVMIAPLPTEVISLSAVAELVVYIPFVTVPAFPVISPVMVPATYKLLLSETSSLTNKRPFKDKSSATINV